MLLAGRLTTAHAMITAPRQWRAVGSCRPLPALLAIAGRASPRPRLSRRPASTLSAIHRGLRLTQKSDRRAGHETDRTTRALAGTASPRQRHKLQKKLGRKAAEEEEEEEEEGNGRQTRRKRFLDPSSSFGKKSLVYQLKYGGLEDEIASLAARQEFRPDGPDTRGPLPRSASSVGGDHGSGKGKLLLGKPAMAGKSDSMGGLEDLMRKSRVSRDAVRESDMGQSTWASSMGHGSGDDEPRLSKPALAGFENLIKKSRALKDSARDPDHDQSTQPSSMDYSDVDGPQFSEPLRKQRRYARLYMSGTRRPRGLHLRFSKRQPRYGGRWIEPQLKEKRALIQPKKTFSITSAASQHLYGRRVVKAALQMGRRAVFNLYRSVSEIETETSEEVITITKLAKFRRAKVIYVPRENRSMLDKLSGGQPHNGFVLEASPLPQPPAMSLGRLEETPGNLGFHIELGFQTWEDQQINGSGTFMARSTQPCPKPLVLVAHEITDPVNLGGLMRTARYFGVDAVGILQRSTASMMSVAALKTSAGAAEEVNLLRVCDTVEFLQKSRRAGWKTFAAVKPPEGRLRRLHPGRFVSSEAVERMAPLDHSPCVIVFGNEGQGLPQSVRVTADYELFIPGFGGDSTGVDSLNVAVAAGMLCHSFVRGSLNSPRTEAGGSSGEAQGEVMF